ncbi:MAG TPA: amidase [Solirubrobacterales bacterium]|nr:amidase [Solirubrobacterales bacterium]
MSEELAFAGAARLAEMLRGREVSSRELTELYLDRIERIDPVLNSFRVVWGEAALGAADRADARLAAGERAPLLGVPIAIKDTVDVAGDVTMLGTAGFDEAATADSTLVARLREAGAVILGKTNLPELAIHGFTESETFGVTRNPWDTGRTPAGSSGGSGAAVAAGLAAVAHASDGAGSIRYPAANCGLFGLKPQRDRVPIDVEHWYGMTVNGCVSRTVADTALFLDAVTAGPSLSPNSAPAPERPFAEAAATPPGSLRIAVSVKPPRAIAPPHLYDESRQAVEGTAERLSSLGHRVEWRDPDWGSIGNQIPARYLGGIADDIRAVPHQERLEKLTRGYRRLARVIAPGMAVRRALRLERADRDRVNAIFDHCDVLLTPMTAGTAVEVGHFHERRPLNCLLGESRYYPYAVAWNHTGQPAAAVPAGLAADGLPIAVQIVAPPNEEARLLSLAAQLEAERPWADTRPTVS